MMKYVIPNGLGKIPTLNKLGIRYQIGSKKRFRRSNQSHKNRSSDRNMTLFISRHIHSIKKMEFTNKTFLYQKIPKNGRVKHCPPYLILCSKFLFQVFKFIFVKVVLDFVIIWRILILAIC